jgi:histidinol-phosphatase (PHP family)
MWSNFHTHSHYCDGKGKIHEYLQAAANAGIESIGFSSHAPLPFTCTWCMNENALPAYLDEIENARRSFPQLEVYKGLEVDYIPGVVSPLTFSRKLDFTIGSIHFVGEHDGKRWEIDNTLQVFKDGLRKIFNDDLRAAVTRYLELTREMLITAPPDILGHLDKIKVNAREASFDESEGWYREGIRELVDTIAERQCIVEVNTRGLYKKKSDTTYPSPWILEQLHDCNIRITISSDAHHPQELTREFGATLALLDDIGFKNITLLQNGIWKEMPLSEYGVAH